MPTAKEVIFGTDASTETQTLSTVTEEQREAIANITKRLQDFDPGTVTEGEKFKFSPGDLSLEGLDQFIRGQGDRELGFGGRLGEIVGQGPQDISEAFKLQVQDPLLKTFEEEVLPGISRKFSGSGTFFSSERARADTAAQGELISTLGRERTRFVMEERARTDALALKGIGLGRQTEQARFDTISKTLLGSAGITTSRILGEGNLNLQKYIAENQAALAPLMGALQGLSIPQIENIISVFQAQPGLLQGIAGGFGQAAGAAVGAAVFSDERLKENISTERGESILAEFLNNLKPAEYDYINPIHGKGKHVSVMAQDLEKSFLGRQMVIDTPEGKMVDYGQGLAFMLASKAYLNVRINELAKAS